MNEIRFPLESLHADALCADMPDCLALMVFAGKGGEVLNELKLLYPQSHSRIYYIEDIMQTQMPKVLSFAETHKIPCIVLNGDEPADPGVFIQTPDSRVSLISRGTEDPDPVQAVLEKMTPSYFTWIGYQRYFTDPVVLDLLSDRYMETLRLGEFRNSVVAAEPLLREASYHFMDLRSVRHSDAPDGICTTPNGLYAEEICTLARYAGLSADFRLAVLYGYPSKIRRDSQIARLTAQVVWHLAEGLAVSVNEHPEKDGDSFRRKVVQMGEDGQELVFLMSKKTGRWWLEVPNSKQPGSPVHIACSTEDYVLACKGEIPIKWLFYYQKSNNFS